MSEVMVVKKTLWLFLGISAGLIALNTYRNRSDSTAPIWGAVGCTGVYWLDRFASKLRTMALLKAVVTVVSVALIQWFCKRNLVDD